MYHARDHQLLYTADPAAGPDSAYERGLKQVLDMVLILLAAPLVAPVFAVAAIAVALGGGSVFYAHERIGRHGSSFRCLKLRTMVPDAEAALRCYLSANPAAAEEWLKTWKLSHDPRTTPVGRFLRRTSLDELPQLINVLRGEMSLVGPRPVTAAELAQYGPAAVDYARVRPGITGLWQVTGRNALSPEERMRLDQHYCNTVSLSADLAILWRTIGAVRRGGQ